MNHARLSSAQADCLAEMGITVWWSQALPAVQPEVEAPGPAITPEPAIPPESVQGTTEHPAPRFAAASVRALAAPSAGAGKQVWGRPHARVLLMFSSKEEIATPEILLKGRPGPLLTAMLASAGVAIDDVGVGLPEAGAPALQAPLVLLLGERACQAVLGISLAQARGRRHDSPHGPAVVCDLPANLRASAALKRLAWDDMRVLSAALAAAAPSAASET